METGTHIDLPASCYSWTTLCVLCAHAHRIPLLHMFDSSFRFVFCESESLINDSITETNNSTHFFLQLLAMVHGIHLCVWMNIEVLVHTHLLFLSKPLYLTGYPASPQT